ncbi:MAG: hypothetical protein EZS28_009877 [Streblomastix strix]|uniref:NrS-1 polymerase-like helicase domain-containing protein n=1 Tax=Streblomastix strix TaxID=222440 RepID=A0A5J4WHQ6_9EUKA|nr:MAG: hypothetical protein EZS28_009877 [Streblomastix strix]
MATQGFSNDKSNQQTSVKCETLERGPKRKYNRKSKTDEKAKAMIDQMINEQTNEQIIEPTNRQIIEEKYDERIHDLIDLEGDLQTRISNQQLAYRLEKNRDDNIFLEMIQPIAELYMQEKDSKTIIERVKDAMINTVNYTKIGQQEGKKQQITGKLIDLSLMDEDNLCVVDIDIHKDKSIEEIDKLRQNLIDSLSPNVGLVKTAHGGLHIYCNRNYYRLPSNRNIKVAVTDSFDIDVFAQMTKYKIENGQETKEIVQNRVVAPNTAIRETKNNQRITLKYEAVNDWENVSHFASLREILDKWNIDIEMSYKDYAQQRHDRIYGVQINDEGTIEQMNDELAQTCVDGLKNLDIHNYPQPINMEVSLLGIFCGLYGISNESIVAEGMKNIRQFNKLSTNVDKNYGQVSSNGERKPNPWILTKILRYHNKDYYEQIIQPLFKKNYEAKKKEKQILINQILIPNKIDLTDDFILLDMQEKAANGEYENEEQIVMDLTKLLIYYEGETEDIYVIKVYDAICDTQALYHKLEGTVYKQLEKININFKNKKIDEKDNSKPITVKHIFKKFASKFVKKGCQFISDDPKILTVFQGYKYKKLDTIDYECLQMYFDLIKETIAACDEQVYEYILNQMAWLIQNPGKKSRAAIVLQGRQGIGKNRLTDVIAELTSRYSCSNITNIDEFTGRFNSIVENKMFAVLNEMMNQNDSKKGVATVMKSIISDLTIRINEMNQPRRTAENVMNIVYVTNADMPVFFGH